jgi:hypothetical protein
MAGVSRTVKPLCGSCESLSELVLWRYGFWNLDVQFTVSGACVYISVEVNGRYIVLKHLSYRTVCLLQPEFQEKILK